MTSKIGPYNSSSVNGISKNPKMSAFRPIAQGDLAVASKALRIIQSGTKPKDEIRGLTCFVVDFVNEVMPYLGNCFKGILSK